MRSRSSVFAVTVAAAMALAGCDGAAEPEPTATPAASASPSPVAPTMATPSRTATPTPTSLPAGVATDAVDAVVAAWNVALSMPEDVTEPTPDALDAINAITSDDSDAAAYLQAQAQRLTVDGQAARGDIIGVPLDDFESTADTFTVTACLSLQATAVDDDRVVSNGTWGAYDLAGTAIDGQVQLDRMANVAPTGPDATETAGPVDDDPSRPAPDACVPPDQATQLLERLDGFIDAYARYSLDTSSPQAREDLEGFTSNEDLLFAFEESLDIAGLMGGQYIATATRTSARLFHCQDPELVPGSSAPPLLWQSNWERVDDTWVVTSTATYGQPERSLLVPFGWEHCLGSP